MTMKTIKKILAPNKSNNSSGFTIVEILVIILIIGVLITVLVLTYSGIQTKQRNSIRINNIKLIQANLETFYVQSGFYPTLDELNNLTWTKNNLKNVDPSVLQDPSSKPNTPRFNVSPKLYVYSYQPTASNGTSSCDDKTIACGKYTLIATLEGNTGIFSQKSLN